MVISIRMTEEEKQLADAYARLNGISLSEAIKRAYFQKIEDEYDIALADAALKEYEKNPKTYNLEELMKELGNARSAGSQRNAVGRWDSWR